MNANEQPNEIENEQQTQQPANKPEQSHSSSVDNAQPQRQEQQTQSDLENNQQSHNPAAEQTTEHKGSDDNNDEGDVSNKLESDQLQQLQNISLRLQADIENMRKRHQKELSAAHKYGQEKLMRELLPVLDSFEMGVQSVEETEANKALLEGMKLTRKILDDALQKHQLSSIEPQGEKFNPELHEAMTSLPMPGVEENTIVEVIQKGYSLPDRLLRPARVIVAAKAG